MKKKKLNLNKKLFLNKELVSDLTKVNGGGVTDQSCVVAITDFNNHPCGGGGGNCNPPEISQGMCSIDQGPLHCVTGLAECGTNMTRGNSCEVCQ